MARVSVGVALISGVKVAVGVPSPWAMAVGVEVFVGVEVIAAELQATIKNNRTNNCIHNSFFILSSPLKLECYHYNLIFLITQIGLVRHGLQVR
jgi:hypothetical protein